MNTKLSDLLHELGISKVKLSKFLGVSRQMIYNYLELDDINKWPKDKKVLMLNLLGIKNAEDIKDIKVDTDYITEVEVRLNSLCDAKKEMNNNGVGAEILNGVSPKNHEMFLGIIDLIKEYLEDNGKDGINIVNYFYHYLQAMNNTKELKYILAYVAKETGFEKPMEFVFEEDEQFIFESIMFSAMVLYKSGKSSKSKLAESHRRFVNQIEQKMEEKLSRTMELNNIKAQALKELGYTEITEDNGGEIIAKMAEIESRKTAFKKIDDEK
jgi:predicted transcriptional regulator